MPPTFDCRCLFGSPFPLTSRLSHFSINEIVFFVYFPSNLNLNVGSETKIVVFYNECRAQNRRKIVLQGKISAQKATQAPWTCNGGKASLGGSGFGFVWSSRRKTALAGMFGAVGGGTRRFWGVADGFYF